VSCKSNQLKVKCKGAVRWHEPGKSSFAIGQARWNENFSPLAYAELRNPLQQKYSACQQYRKHKKKNKDYEME